MAVLIKDIVPSFFQQKQGWHASLLANWDQIVGSLKTRVRLEKIQDDTLIIGVYESHWMQELYLLSQLLIDTINQFLGESRIKKLHFKLVEERKRSEKKMAVHKPQLRQEVMLTIAQKRALEAIADAQLKEALIQFWSRCSD